jgi:membrane-associated protease RseP (regulator of RpoE activity)
MPGFQVDNFELAKAIVQTNWRNGLVYMAAVMAILLMHEMGHFVQTLRYRVPASLPLFLPVPVFMGTMGAVIIMDPSKANRKQLFDIGLWGPWAGLVVAIPMIWFGIQTAQTDPAGSDFRFGTPLVFKLITKLIVASGRPELAGAAIKANPLFMAGWVGMLVTGLNMLPVSQLDGGHVIYGLFGRRSKWIARAFIVAAIGFIIVTEQYNWIVMLVLVLLLGVDHPPTEDDSVPLGPVRWTIGLVSLLIPVFCFTPVMIPGG